MSRGSRVLIKNGLVTDPASGLCRRMDLRTEGDIISEMGNLTPKDADEKIIDASGLTVAPGFIDSHAHFRDPGFTYKEDLHTGSLSAAKGGYTSVICMANTDPPVDKPEVLLDILNRAKNESVRIYQAAAVSRGLKGNELTDFEALARSGAVSFTDDGFALMDEKLCEEAMRKAAKLHKPLCLHEENRDLIAENGINHGKISEFFGIEGSPAEAEESMVKRDLRLARATGAKVVIQHVSSAGTVKLIRKAKESGVDVHAEATPHHFALTEDAVLTKKSLAKVNPPIRAEKDRLAIIEGLRDGTIDMIATDHAPHSDAEKAAKPFWTAPSGVIGLETAFGAGMTYLVRPGHLTLMQLLFKMTCAPAKVYSLPGGRITPGAPADLTVFDPDRARRADTFASKSSNCAFAKETLYGLIRYTVRGGRIIYDSENKIRNDELT